jgi:membrane protease YdiL (CAAX protease family)
VLSPDSALTPYVLGVALAALLAFMTVRAVRKDRREYGRFKRMRATSRRQKVFRKWVRESFVTFGGSAVVVLALVWQFIPLFLDAVDRWAFVADARRTFANSGTIGVGLVVGFAAALVVGTLLVVVLARKETEVASVGDVQALLPRNRAELRYGAALAINAGVVEELLFRLALPALVFGLTRSAVAAVVVSIVVFAMLHVYQGVAGIVGALVIGTLLMAVYLATGSILVAIVVHALFDLRSLVLIPIVVFGVHKELGNGKSAAPVAKPVRTAVPDPLLGSTTVAADHSGPDDRP